MKKHISKIEDFVLYIKNNTPVETTNHWIAVTFFNNNKGLTSDVIRQLKEHSVVMTNKSWRKGKGQMWYYIEGHKDLETIFCCGSSGTLNSGTLTSGTLTSGSPGTLTKSVKRKFLYKGIKEIEIEITVQDKERARQSYEMLGELLCEDMFIKDLVASGMKKEKAWFLFTKLVQGKNHYLIKE